MERETTNKKIESGEVRMGIQGINNGKIPIDGIRTRDVEIYDRGWRNSFYVRL